MTYGLRAKEQRYKGGLLRLHQAVFQQRAKLIKALIQLLPVHSALTAVGPQGHAAEPAVVSFQYPVRFQELFQGIRLGKTIVIHDPHIIIASLHRPAHSKVEAPRAA